MTNIVQFPRAYMPADDALRRVAEDMEAGNINPVRIVILLEEEHGGRVSNRMAVGGTDSLKDVSWMLRVASESITSMTSGE